MVPAGLPSQTSETRPAVGQPLSGTGQRPGQDRGPRAGAGGSEPCSEAAWSMRLRRPPALGRAANVPGLADRHGPRGAARLLSVLLRCAPAGVRADGCRRARAETGSRSAVALRATLPGGSENSRTAGQAEGS